MGSNVSPFIEEANRILKTGGKLIIAEVKSRIENQQKFRKALGQYGFQHMSENADNTHFVLMFLKKFKDLDEKKRRPPLKFRVCQYKKR
jgi:ribosomal RNA-processing protein 8